MDVPLMIVYSLTGPPMLLTGIIVIGINFRKRAFNDATPQDADVPVEAIILPDPESEITNIR